MISRFVLLLLTDKAAPVWAGAVFSCLGLVFLVVGIQGLHNAVAPAATAVTEARVAQIDRKGKQHLVFYRFNLPGALGQGAVEIPAEQAARIQVGDTLRIVYSTVDPGINWLDGQQADWTGQAILAGFGVLFAGIGLLLLITQTREFRTAFREAGARGPAADSQLAAMLFRSWQDFSHWILVAATLAAAGILSKLALVNRISAFLSDWSGEIAAVVLLLCVLGFLVLAGGIALAVAKRKRIPWFHWEEWRRFGQKGRWRSAESRPILIVFIGIGLLASSVATAVLVSVPSLLIAVVVVGGIWVGIQVSAGKI
jgi:hypothetical protein